MAYDYVAYAAELTTVAETAAGVLGPDTPAQRLAKLQTWNAGGGLLAAIVAGSFHATSTALGGGANKLDDIFVENVSLDPSGLQYSSATDAAFKVLTDRKWPARTAKLVSPRDVIVDSAVTVIADVGKAYYVPNNQDLTAWAAGAFAKIGSVYVTWSGTAWTALSAPLVPTFAAPTKNATGFTVQVSNYSASYTWKVAATAGTVSINGSGLITVTGLPSGVTAPSTVTVTSRRALYATGGAVTTSTTT